MTLSLPRLTLLFLVMMFARFSSSQEEAKEDTLEMRFLHACSSGDADKVKQYLQSNPELAHARTPEGETGLHVAAIPGSAQVTKLLLEAGADPNARTTFDKGLRMHPLSWNAYAGHLDNIGLLLHYGAHVNADVDSMFSKEDRVTALDILNHASHASSGGDSDRFEQAKAMLIEQGAKTYDEL